MPKKLVQVGSNEESQPITTELQGALISKSMTLFLCKIKNKSQQHRPENCWFLCDHWNNIQKTPGTSLFSRGGNPRRMNQYLKNLRNIGKKSLQGSLRKHPVKEILQKMLVWIFLMTV